MDTAAAASTVRIAVNDFSDLPVLFSSVDDDLLIPLRAVKSLSRLDAVLRAEKHDVTSASEMLAAYHLAYKCPSFPRIDRYSSMDEMRLAIDADSMSPRLSNATLSQDLDAELLAMSISSLCVPSQQTSSSRHDSTLTRSASARTIRLAPNAAATGSALNNLLLPPVSVTTTTTHSCRRVTRSTSCPSMSLASHLSPSPSSLLHLLPTHIVSSQRHAGRLPGAVATTTKAGRSRSRVDDDVDLNSEHVTDLPLIATSDFPDFLPDQSTGSEVAGAWPVVGAQLTAELMKSTRLQRYGVCEDADRRLLSHLNSYRSCRPRAPQLVQIKCLQWLNSLDQGAV